MHQGKLLVSSDTAGRAEFLDDLIIWDTGKDGEQLAEKNWPAKSTK